MRVPGLLHLLEVVLEDIPYGLSIGTPNGRVVCYNRAMQQISGYTKDEVNESGWFDLVFPDEQERSEAVAKAKRSLNGLLSYTEADITCKDGTRKTVAFFLADTVIDHRKYNFGIMIPLDQVFHRTELEMETAYGLYRKLRAQVDSLN